MYLNYKHGSLHELAQSLKSEYQKNVPFPHIVVDDFFREDFLSSVLDDFSDLSKENTNVYDNKKENKFAHNNYADWGRPCLDLVHFLNGAEFLGFLQKISGIPETLISDPYLLGGGKHETKKGGFLKIHTDFNKHSKIDMDRRLNVLVYLNKNWQDDWGGNFELWDKEVSHCQKTISPKFNRLVVFNTTDVSFHGHPNPLTCPSSESRKSMAFYYYSVGRSDIKNRVARNTVFVNRKGNKSEPYIWRVQNRLKHIAKEWIPPILLKLFK